MKHDSIKDIRDRLQKFTFTKSFEKGIKPCDEWPDGARITADIRFDDECKNGHNSFAITGHIKEPEHRDWSACGCIHEDIAKYFPELKKYIKWHFVSSDEPMYYIENTMYHSEEQEEGIPCEWGEEYYFKGFPIQIDVRATGVSKEFIKWIMAKGRKFKYQFVKEEYTPDLGNYDFGPKVNIKGFRKRGEKKWYGCPFDDYREATEFMRAFKDFGIITKKVVTGYTEKKICDLKAARSTAIAPRATKKQLQDKEWLLDRLPWLMLSFEKDMNVLREM